MPPGRGALAEASAAWLPPRALQHGVMLIEKADYLKQLGITAA
jgi:hypothetical protein